MTCAYRLLLVLISSLFSRIRCSAALSEDSATCHFVGDCSDRVSSKASASLLQKASLREEKIAITTESSAAPCTGVQAQGKCWYLSDLGESCSSTCAKNGLVFSFVVADNNDPITPKLMKWTEPNELPIATSATQQPLAPLECLGSDKVHFHLASADAALNFIGDMSSWKHNACQLACPCGEAGQCRWKQPPACAPEFEWMGAVYTGCPTVDHDGPWCMHHYQHTGKDDFDANDWSYCTYSCAPDGPTYATENGCFWKPASSCVVEFDYEGTHFLGCTNADHHTPWCSNSDPYKGSWNHCEYVCDNKETTSKPQEETDEKVCYWQASANCSSSFNYKGVDYNGCTAEDNPTPWCSYDRVHNGLWTVCTRVCTAPDKTPAPPIIQPVVTSTAAPPTPKPTPPVIAPSTPSPITPAPITPAPATAEPGVGVGGTTPRPIDHRDLPLEQLWEGQPCERHPESENDYIGWEATLDEEGYKICTMADSPINMKRFICRVVYKIGCHVVQYEALVGFVPYYSGAVSAQSYQHLEDELKIICHAGGKWVIPIEESEA